MTDIEDLPIIVADVKATKRIIHHHVVTVDGESVYAAKYFGELIYWLIDNDRSVATLRTHLGSLRLTFREIEEQDSHEGPPKPDGPVHLKGPING